MCLCLIFQAVQADNGSLLYYLPGYQHGYSSYNPIIPGAVVGVDGQYLGQPYYPMLQQAPASPGFVPQSVVYGPDLVPACPWDSSLLFVNGLQVQGIYGDPTTPAPKSSFPSRSQTLASSKTSTSSKSPSSELKGLDVKPTDAVPKQSLRPVNKVL